MGIARSGVLLNLAAKKADIPLFEYLLSKGADITKSHPLHSAAQIVDPARKEDMKAIMKHLVTQHSLDPNAEDETEYLLFQKGCPIEYAAFENNP